MRQTDLANTLLFLMFAGLAVASTQPADTAVTSKNEAPAILDGDFKSAIVVDAETGIVLAEKNAHKRRQPASMVKMMTELIVLDRCGSGDIALGDTITVSAKASRMGGSQVFLKQGETFTVEELLEALAVHSANDAAVALAQYVAGSVPAFVDLMNLKAQSLGMNDTEYHSVHGLPPGRGQEPDLTTASDLATLAKAVIKHPESLKWASMDRVPFRGGEFTLYNPNHLVGHYRGLDGLKTGYHAQAGYCVTATAVQRGKRLISVVMGCSTDRARATETTRLLSYGFSLYTPVTLVADAKEAIAEPVAVDGGKTAEVHLVYAEPLTVTVPKTRRDEVKLELDLPPTLRAPLAEGEQVGRAVALLDGHEIGSVPVLTATAIAKGNWLDRLFH